MHYYTDYQLVARRVKNEEQFNELVETLKEKDLINYAFDEGHYYHKQHEAWFMCIEGVCWYEHTKDMIYIAEKFPNIYFELSGTGEDFGDFWKEYYHDMDIEYCRGEIVYEQPKKIQWTELVKF